MAKKFKKANDTSLVLRVCKADMTSRNGFVWPEKIGEEISAPDWKSNDECGNGLHGWLYGQGEHDCVSYWDEEGAKWLVLEVVSSDIVMLGGKCKFQRATVVFIGSKSDAAKFIVDHEPRSKDVAVIGASIDVGEKGCASAGALSTLTGGDGSELRIQWFDSKADRRRTSQAYVGENGIKPNTPYQLNEKHEFVEVV